MTHCEDSVLDLHWLEASGLHPDDLETVSRNMALHLRRLVEQRDSQLEVQTPTQPPAQSRSVFGKEMQPPELQGMVRMP